MGFGAANALFSAAAFKLVEPPEADEKSDEKDKEERLPKITELLYGRRRLLLASLAGGTVMLFILTFLLRLPVENPNKLGAVLAFVFLFTICYSPGAGAIPFVYSAEVWPNEGRGM
jgi:hypothetical protein